MSLEPFNTLVKLAARAFYDDITLKGDNQTKNGRSDNRGMAVVMLDALTRRQWVREEDLAKDLKMHSKQLRRTLRFFEEEKLVTRDHRKETAKGAKIFSKAVAATGDGVHKEGEEKIKLHTHSYCCLDYSQVFSEDSYARKPTVMGLALEEPKSPREGMSTINAISMMGGFVIYDVVRYRLHRMKKQLKDELVSKDTVQKYVCPDCGRRYDAYDSAQLMSHLDEFFHCESCNTILVAESDKLAAEEMGGGDDNARRRRREKLKDMLQKMEVQLKPLMVSLNRVKDLVVPEFGTLQAWEARANAANRAANGDSSNDPNKSAQGQGYGGTPMPFLGETKVEVAFGVKEEDTKPEAAAMKVLPPWMIKQGMNLTKEQRGEVKQELNVDNKSAPSQLSEDKKSKMNEKEDDKSIQDEYVKAYYAALLKRQEEAAKSNQQEVEGVNDASNSFSEMPSDRQVGRKSKRDEDHQDDDVEWEEAPTAGNTTLTHKVHDLNVEAEESGDDEDEIDWEEG